MYCGPRTANEDRNSSESAVKKSSTSVDPLPVPDSFADHVKDDLLEGYALAALEADTLAYVEEHLLVCEDCRVRLQTIEEFVADFRTAVEQSGACV